jgi:hypothetical protein
MASDDSLEGFAMGDNARSDARLASLEHALTTVLQVMVMVMIGVTYNGLLSSSCT